MEVEKTVRMKRERMRTKWMTKKPELQGTKDKTFQMSILLTLELQIEKRLTKVIQCQTTSQLQMKISQWVIKLHLAHITCLLRVRSMEE